MASAFEFYNGENLLLPAFEYDPHTNLSTVISFSIDNKASKVELAEDAEPIRITFHQVFFSDRYIYCLSPAFPSAKCKLWFLGLGRAHLVFWRVSTELRAQHQRGDGVRLFPTVLAVFSGVRLFPPHKLQPLHGLDRTVLWIALNAHH